MEDDLRGIAGGRLGDIPGIGKALTEKKLPNLKGLEKDQDSKILSGMVKNREGLCRPPSVVGCEKSGGSNSAGTSGFA